MELLHTFVTRTMAGHDRGGHRPTYRVQAPRAQYVIVVVASTMPRSVVSKSTNADTAIRKTPGMRVAVKLKPLR